jgi:outer membrane protein OmpA-like peptidoglycan-associated protein
MMKYFSIWHLLLCAWILLGTYFARPYLAECWCGSAAKTGAAWNIKDEGFKTIADQHFRFYKSDAAYVEPTSTSMNASLAKTVEHLKSNVGRTLLICGYYTADEKAPALFPNLGLARANDIKSLMVSLGAPPAQIDIESSLVSSKEYFLKDTLKQGVEFKFNQLTADATNNHLAAIKAKLLGKPMILHFALNQSEIQLTDEQKDNFADMMYYLDKVPSSKLDIAGHTDNQGKPNVNQSLSQQRAESVRAYIAKTGNLPADRMIAQGFGPSKPLAPNTTPENKALNRRVEIILE